MDNDPTAAIHRILVEDHGVPARKVTKDARIVHDLGVDGDDAAELLERLHRQFGTDFSSLDAQWRDFFNTEGASPLAILVGIPTLVACATVSGVTSALLHWPKFMAFVVALGLFVAVCWLVSRRFGRHLRPLTVRELSRIVEAGRWPADPADVQ